MTVSFLGRASQPGRQNPRPKTAASTTSPLTRLVRFAPFAPLMLLCIALLGAPFSAHGADTLPSLESTERKLLDAYLAGISAGQRSDAAMVDRLADVPFDGLRRIIEAYAALDPPIEPHTHRAFQALLDRTSRTALAPWPMIKLYSPEFAAFLTNPEPQDQFAERLVQRLVDGVDDRRADDLAVRLAPGASLRHLAGGSPLRRAELLDAWCRRLQRGIEKRPIPNVEDLVRLIVHAWSIRLPVSEVESRLRFASLWPSMWRQYEAQLDACLTSDDPALVLAGLAVQRTAPARLERNAALVERFADRGEIIERAVGNYGDDAKGDHSATLRALWPRLPGGASKARYQALVAMGVHPHGNDELAAEAVIQQPFAFMDAAAAVLKLGRPEAARRAIRHVLSKRDRGREEALRLATEMKLKGFEEEALGIALGEAAGESGAKSADQILRVRAILYLQNAQGDVRRKLLPLLTAAGNDLRLAAIQAFAVREGLAGEDLEEIGPALTSVALNDRSMGHRQEAVHALGQWKHPQTKEIFEQMLRDNPPVPLEGGHYDDAHFWRYRLRLVALLGMARQNDSKAREEFLDLHSRGSETERMDVLLCWNELGIVPDAAFDDLDSSEPKVVATVVELVRDHGTTSQRERVLKYFQSHPLWNEFQAAGLDDHGIRARLDAMRQRLAGESKP